MDLPPRTSCRQASAPSKGRVLAIRLKRAIVKKTSGGSGSNFSLCVSLGQIQLLLPDIEDLRCNKNLGTCSNILVVAKGA